MKRTLTLALVLALVFSLVFPTVALAKRGGVPANGKNAAPEAVEDAGDATADEEPAAETGADKGRGQEKQEAKDGIEEPGDQAAEQDRDRDRDRSGETSATAETKRTGVANALSRLQDNLARMQADLEAGTRTGLPRGLQAVIVKFMSWLGIDPAAEAENADEGSDESSGTVEPEPADDADDADAGSTTTPEAPAEE